MIIRQLAGFLAPAAHALCRPSPTSLLASAVLALVSTAGFIATNQNSTLSASFAFMLSWAFLYVLVRGLFALWDAPREAGGTAYTAWRTSEKKFFLISSLGLFAIWLLWIVPHWPGTMRDDTIPQYLQYMGFTPYYTQHPIFDTLCFGVFFNIGDAMGSMAAGLFAFIVVQAAVTSLCFSAGLLFLRRCNVPRIAILAFFAFYAFSRVIYQPIDTMSKDAWNGWILCLCCLMLFEVIRTKGAVLKNTRFLLAFIACLFCCIASKRIMLFVFVPTLLLCAIAQSPWRRCGAGQPVRTAICAIVPAVLFACIWNPATVAMLGASQNTTYEIYTIPAQQVTATAKAHPDALTEEEAQLLDQCIDIERATSIYNPVRSDEVLWCIRTESFEPAKLIQVWLSLGLRYPADYAMALLNLEGTWLSLFDTIDYAHNLEDDVLGSEQRFEEWGAFFTGGASEAHQALDGFLAQRPEVLQAAYAAVEFLDPQSLILAPIASYGLYCFALPLIALAWAIRRRNAQALLMMAAPVLILLSCYAGPIALCWYALPLCYLMPLIVSTPWLAQGMPAR